MITYLIQIKKIRSTNESGNCSLIFTYWLCKYQFTITIGLFYAVNISNKKYKTNEQYEIAIYLPKKEHFQLLSFDLIIKLNKKNRVNSLFILSVLLFIQIVIVRLIMFFGKSDKEKSNIFSEAFAFLFNYCFLSSYFWLNEG